MTKLKRQGLPGKVRRSMPVGIDYAALLEAIARVLADAQRHAVQAVNLGLTLRNWAIGYYIVEYEMNGSDRAQYGERLLDSLARDLVRRLGRGFARRNLFRFCEFYRRYPIVPSLIAQFNLLLPQLTADLRRRVGKGFTQRNLEYVRLFYQRYPIAKSLISQFDS